MPFKNQTFYPPKPNGLVKFILKCLWPVLSPPLTAGGFTLKINAEDFERLQSISNQPCFIFPNHPTTTDPLVIYKLGEKLKKNFYFVSAFEHFIDQNKWQGLLLQRMGCYSIIRGKTDKKSFDCTLDIIKNNLGPLVIFAEGEVSNANDIMLPFQEGVVQLAQLAHRQLNKLQPNASAFICPVFVQYDYPKIGLETALTKSILRLENELKILNASSSLYQRLLEIGQVLLHAASLELGMTLPENIDWPEKRELIQESILKKLQGLFGITPEENATTVEQVRQVVTRINTAILNEDEQASPYVKRRLSIRNQFLRQFYPLTDRILHFLTLYPNYLTTQEVNHRYVELVMRYEKEVFGKILFRHPKTAQVFVAQPIELNAQRPIERGDIFSQIQVFYQTRATQH
jgi:1-acyl-sn-glycerol-3-phosphate acyltransferase